MPMTAKGPGRVVAVAATTLAVMAGTAGLAAAQETDDPRATPHPGNATTCTGGQDPAGLSGDILMPGIDFTFTRGVDDVDQFVDILSLSPGVTVSGIVVKGGPNYNVYVPGEKGLPPTPPWTDLRSPLVGMGNVPAISHWFVCGMSGGTTTTTTTTTETTETTTETTETTTPTETTTETTETTTPTETTTTGTTTKTTITCPSTTTKHSKPPHTKHPDKHGDHKHGDKHEGKHGDHKHGDGKYGDKAEHGKYDGKHVDEEYGYGPHGHKGGDKDGDACGNSPWPDHPAFKPVANNPVLGWLTGLWGLLVVGGGSLLALPRVRGKLGKRHQDDGPRDE